jgi:GGDEF domain-containing protein
MSFDRARSLMLYSGLALLGVISLVALLRGVDRVEVAGTLFFIPIFAGFIFMGIRGSLALAAAAIVGYLLLRLPAIRLVGIGPLAGQLFARVVGYLVFAAGGGWAAAQLKISLDKLELHDTIDDETGLFNARSFVETIDLERSRATRYEKVFSVVVAEFDVGTWGTGKKGRSQLKELGARMAAAVRHVDHVVHARTNGRHVLAVVLPETGREGAGTVAMNLRRHLVDAAGDREIRVTTTTFPGDEEHLDAMVGLFREIDRTQHDESHSVSQTPQTERRRADHPTEG